MKWFTQEYMKHGDPKDTTRKEYESYIATIKDHLPGNLADICDFSEGYVWHTQLPDGNIRSILSDFDAKTVVIEMNASYWWQGDWKGIPFEKEKGREVWLRYFEVIEYRLIDPWLTPGRGSSSIGDNAFDEVELISPGIFEHRLLFHSGVEIAVRFRGFRLDYENLE